MYKVSGAGFVCYQYDEAELASNFTCVCERCIGDDYQVHGCNIYLLEVYPQVDG